MCNNIPWLNVRRSLPSLFHSPKGINDRVDFSKKLFRELHHLLATAAEVIPSFLPLGGIHVVLPFYPSMVLSLCDLPRSPSWGREQMHPATLQWLFPSWDGLKWQLRKRWKLFSSTRGYDRGFKQRSYWMRWIYSMIFIELWLIVKDHHKCLVDLHP